ncbi:hypothetical protein V8B97DRAFT_2023561 [Scleroderma yunnanense]
MSTQQGKCHADNVQPSLIDLIQLSESLGSMESSLNVDRKALLLSRHPSSVTGYLDMPAIILGKGDTIALWYLPGGLAWPMQEHVLGTIYPLEHSLKQSISDFFTQDDHRLSGCLEFSPARHELGHATWEDDPAISSALATDAGRQILSGTLSIMHPLLYDAGLEAMKALRQWSAVADHAMSDALFQWPIVYTNVSVIANHSASLHHDPHSCTDWYDLLVSLGEYTDLAFSGRLLWHGDNAISGNRYSLAYYMRDNVHNWLNVPRGNWMRVHTVQNALMSM